MGHSFQTSKTEHQTILILTALKKTSKAEKEYLRLKIHIPFIFILEMLYIHISADTVILGGQQLLV